FRVFHGATDAPAVDVRLADGGAVLVDDLSYQEFSDYLNVAADMYEIDITAAGNGSAVVASYGLDISSLNGGSALILASGFLAPGDNQNGEAFELLVVLASGDSFVLPLSTSIDSDMNTAPVAFELQGNYPNPFNPTTNIQFSVPNTADVSLTVYDLLGRQVAVLVNGTMSAGSHVVLFDASNLASGTYMYRLQSGNMVETSKMMLIK
ncbi:MAG: T9SS type A sorting domain-containing protein, partial [Balneolales bacterium]|nr:T9SS type A sorting domain-containing protein [Balneolales bacterium]